MKSILLALTVAMVGAMLGLAVPGLPALIPLAIIGVGLLWAVAEIVARIWGSRDG